MERRMTHNVSHVNSIAEQDEATLDSLAAQSALAAQEYAAAAAAAALEAEQALATLLEALADYLPLAGGTMLGKITLDGDPSSALHAATKAYVDAVSGVITAYLPIAGGTMEGFLVLDADPTLALHAATKQYVDGVVTGIGSGIFLELAGGTMTGDLELAGAPTLDAHAATKEYVDDGDAATLAAAASASETYTDNAIAAIYNPLDYDVSLFVEGVDPGSSTVLLLFVSPTTFRIDSSPIACRGYALVPATDGDTDYDIQLNGVSVGTCTFPDSTAAATFTIGSDIVVDPGDRLTIIGPATADTDLADFCITLRGVLEA
jgi:hypothetical protein